MIVVRVRTFCSFLQRIYERQHCFPTIPSTTAKNLPMKQVIFMRRQTQSSHHFNRFVYTLPTSSSCKVFSCMHLSLLCVFQPKNYEQKRAESKRIFIIRSVVKVNAHIKFPLFAVQVFRCKQKTSSTSCICRQEWTALTYMRALAMQAKR